MKKNELKQLILEVKQELLVEFEADLKKQCVVLMGLPAAGKSTFINNEIGKYVSIAKDYKINNSDTQVVNLQFKRAKIHYDYLVKNVKEKQDIDIFVNDTIYINNSGKNVKHPITFDWWEKNKGLKQFYKDFRKSYYATYFDIRDLAKELSIGLFDTKVHNSGDLIVIDTTGTNINSIYKQLKKTKEEDFNNTIIFLDIDAKLSIVRDAFREKTQGRGVGNNVIIGYIDKIKAAYKTYTSNSEDLIDRLLHFIWVPQGDSPIKGKWVLKKDIKFHLLRKLKNG